MKYYVTLFLSYCVVLFMVPELSMNASYHALSAWMPDVYRLYKLDDALDAEDVVLLGFLNYMMIRWTAIFIHSVLSLDGALLILPIYVVAPVLIMGVDWDEAQVYAICLNALLTYTIVYRRRLAMVKKFKMRP